MFPVVAFLMMPVMRAGPHKGSLWRCEANCLKAFGTKKHHKFPCFWRLTGQKPRYCYCYFDCYCCCCCGCCWLVGWLVGLVGWFGWLVWLVGLVGWLVWLVGLVGLVGWFGWLVWLVGFLVVWLFGWLVGGCFVVVLLLFCCFVVVLLLLLPLPLQLFSQSRSGQKSSNRWCFRVFVKRSEQNTP